MDARPPTQIILANLWVFALAALAAITQIYQKVQSGHLVFTWWRFFGEMITSAFVGVITFLICDAAGLEPVVSAAMVGVASHMGSRAIFLLEGWLKARFPQ